MSDNKCPKCGTEKIPARLDGSNSLDGSTDLSGYICPKCNPPKKESK